jgi:hypothetical protein
MPLIEWRHDRRSLQLPVVVMAPLSAANPNLSIHTIGLLDTGATQTGIRVDIAKALHIPRRVGTANGSLMASEYLLRIGFICGDHADPSFSPDQQLPYMLEEQVLGFELQRGFNYPLLIGMNILGSGDLSILHDGQARFQLY